MKVQVETITPGKAELMLLKSRRFNNRSISKAKVNLYANQMASGEWQLNGESLVFDENDQCIDGQHRLEAIFKSGSQIETVVSRGVSKEVFKTIDSGVSRTAGHVLGIAGYGNGPKLAAMISAAMNYVEYGVCEDALRSGGTYTKTGTQALRFVEQYPDIDTFLKTHHTGDYNLLYKNKAFYHAAVYSLMYLLWRNAPDEVNEFMKGLSTGENLSIDDPRLTLSNKLSALNATRKEQKPSKSLIVSLYIQAWNAFVSCENRKTFNTKMAIPKVKTLDINDLRGVPTGESL